MDFTTMDISTLTRSVTGKGVRYLELFLKEYSSLFPGQLNPSCPKCLTQYLTKYKNHYNTMANPSPYRLRAKYENIPLEFGSPILVNNGNITDDYALKLLQHNNGQRYFSQLPNTAEAPSPKSQIPKNRSQKKTKAIANDISENKTVE